MRYSKKNLLKLLLSRPWISLPFKGFVKPFANAVSLHSDMLLEDEPAGGQKSKPSY
jgi:hypothetical protein